MSGKFIIVERDICLRDCGVFTGQIQIVDSRLDIEGCGPLQVMDGISSTDIEHAFLFNSTWDAWRFARQFQPHKECAVARWVARKDGDYFPGECRHGVNAPNPTSPTKNWIPHEMIVAAAERGYQQGRSSALAENRT